MKMKPDLKVNKDFIYEEEPISRSQKDIKCKTCDIRTWKK
jgi:hypothetical protein